MFFRRKGWLRSEFDEKLIDQLKRRKKEWDRQNDLNEQSYDPFGEMDVLANLAKAKYIFLLKEAKKRHLSILK